MGEKAKGTVPLRLPLYLGSGQIDYLHYLVEMELYGNSDREWKDLKASTCVKELRELENLLTTIARGISTYD